MSGSRSAQFENEQTTLSKLSRLGTTPACSSDDLPIPLAAWRISARDCGEFEHTHDGLDVTVAPHKEVAMACRQRLWPRV